MPKLWPTSVLDALVTGASPTAAAAVAAAVETPETTGEAELAAV